MESSKFLTWIFSFNNELYHSNEKAFGVNYFCDLSAKYKAKTWEIAFVANNLTGISTYEQIFVSSSTHSYTMTKKIQSRKIYSYWGFAIISVALIAIYQVSWLWGLYQNQKDSLETQISSLMSKDYNVIKKHI